MKINVLTDKIYYQNRYQKETIVWVDDYGIDEDGKHYLIFSETVFFPKGGGQKGDKGTLYLNDEIVSKTSLPNEISIIDTRKRDERILHYINTNINKEIYEDYIIGSQFNTKLDWSFRYQQMKLHSIAHLHHCFLEKVLGHNIDFPIYSEMMSDYGINRYPMADIIDKETEYRVLNELNIFLSESHEILVYQNSDKNHPDWYRWWECGEWKIPCGGIHPLNTNEIGCADIDILSKKGNTTVTFKVNESFKDS